MLLQYIEKSVDFIQGLGALKMLQEKSITKDWLLEGNRADFGKILIENPINKSGDQGWVGTTPPLISELLYKIFFQNFRKIRPVAFQWPV